MPRSHRIPVDKGVVLYRRGLTWWVDIHRGGQARIRRNTKTRDRNKALLIAREVAGSILSGTWNVKLASETMVEGAIELYRTEYQASRHSQGTQYYTSLLFPRFVEFIKVRHAPPVTLDAITRGDLEAFQSERSRRITHHGKLVSPWTVNRDLRELGTFFRWAVGRAIVRVNPCQGLRSLKVVTRVRRILSPTECDRLFRALPHTLADIVALILNSGLRLGEATHLRVEDVDLKARLLSIRSRPGYLVKTRAEREVPLNAVSASICDRRTHEAEPQSLLFPSQQGTIIGNRNAERSLHIAAKRAGVVLERAFYSLRHCFASNSAKHMPPFALAKILGNSVDVAEKHYVHLRGQDLMPPPVLPLG